MRDYGPLVILGSFLFLVLAVATIPAEEALATLTYLPIVFIIATISYIRGIRPVDPDFPPSLFWLAFVLKLTACVVYYWVISEVYGRGDANVYHREGQYVAQYFSRFDLSILKTYSVGREGSANAVVHLTGLLYTFLPPTRQGGGLFFATLAFVGYVSFYRAFRLAFPQARPHFYRLVLFFLPSILFWTSAVGKDAWVLFGSGFVAYGLVQYARQARLAGLALALVGLFAVYLVRPHFAAFVIVAAGLAYLLFQRIDSPRGFLTWLVGGGLILVLGAFLLQAAGEYLDLGDISEVSWQAVEATYEFRQEVSYGGGSGFSPVVALTPLGLISAPVTVLFRPFPWEANNVQALVASLESLLWLGLFWHRRRVFWSRLRSLRADPWVAFTVGYSAIMIVAFTTVSNFGILARQRVLFLPFLWMLFA